MSHITNSAPRREGHSFHYPTAGQKIVRPVASFLFYFAVWMALIIGAPALVFLIVGR